MVKKVETKIFKNIRSIGIVVHDIKATMETYYQKYGMGPWLFEETQDHRISHTMAAGIKTNVYFKKAAYKLNDVVLELVEPRNEQGPFFDFLGTRGEGVQYLEYETYDYAISYEYLKKINGVPVFEGDDVVNGNFAFFNADNSLKHIVKIVEKDDTSPEYGYHYPAGKAGEPAFEKVFQVAMAVQDIKKAVKNCVRDYGIEPWSFSYFNKNTVKNIIADSIYDEFNFVVATCMVGNIELEFMQPFEDDKGVYKRFIQEKGEGIHHICMLREKSKKFWEEMDREGQKLVQGGEWFGCTFVHMASEPALKFSLELYDSVPGFKRPEPAFIIDRHSTG